MAPSPSHESSAASAIKCVVEIVGATPKSKAGEHHGPVPLTDCLGLRYQCVRVSRPVEAQNPIRRYNPLSATHWDVKRHLGASPLNGGRLPTCWFACASKQC